MVRWVGRARCWSIWEGVLIKCNVTGDDDFACGKIKTSVALVFKRVAEENAAGRARGKFMGAGGIEIREA